MVEATKIRCQCGQFKAELKPSRSALHVQCFCCDCQSFAKHVQQQDRVLDEHGGTELLQTYPAHLNICQGEEQLQAMQLKPKGIYRWYTRCCNTPIANTMNSAGMPFVGVLVNNMQFENEQHKQQMLGPIMLKAFGKHALNGKPSDAHDTYPKSFMAKMAWFMIKGKLLGKANPSPFFKHKQVVCKVEEKY